MFSSFERHKVHNFGQQAPPLGTKLPPSPVEKVRKISVFVRNVFLMLKLYASIWFNLRGYVAQYILKYL